LIQTKSLVEHISLLVQRDVEEEKVLPYRADIVHSVSGDDAIEYDDGYILLALPETMTLERSVRSLMQSPTHMNHGRYRVSMISNRTHADP